MKQELPKIIAQDPLVRNFILLILKNAITIFFLTFDYGVITFKA